MKNELIKEAGFNDVRSCFLVMLSETCDIVGQKFYSEVEKQKWLETVWEDNQTNILSCLSEIAKAETDLVNKCTLNDVTVVIEKLAIPIFGFNINKLLED